MKARHEQPLVLEAERFRAGEEGLALGAEVVRPPALDRAQGLGLGPILLDQREPGFAFLLAEDLARACARARPRRARGRPLRARAAAATGPRRRLYAPGRDGLRPARD